MSLGELSQLEFQALAVVSVQGAHHFQLVNGRARPVLLAREVIGHLRLRVAYRTFP